MSFMVLVTGPIGGLVSYLAWVVWSLIGAVERYGADHLDHEINKVDQRFAAGDIRSGDGGRMARL